MADDFIPDDGFVPDASNANPWNGLPHDESGRPVVTVTPKAPFNPNPVTDIPRQVGQDFASALTAAYEGLNPYSATHAAISEQGTKPDDPAVDQYAGTAGRAMSHLAAAGKGALAIPAAVFAAPVGAYESLVGHSLAAVSPKDYYGKDLSPEEIYERAKAEADLALNAAGPGRAGNGSFWRRGQPLEAPGPFGITLSKGEETGDLASRQEEQAGIRGGNPYAQQWVAQRQEQLAAAKEELARRMDVQAQYRSPGMRPPGFEWQDRVLDPRMVDSKTPAESWGTPQEYEKGIEDEVAAVGWKGSQAQELRESLWNESPWIKKSAVQNPPFGTVLAQTPQEAGQIASDAIQRKAAASKEAVRQAYEQARAQPGTFEPGVFDNMTDGIRSDLSLADKPVDLDDKLTPFASKMVNVLDDRIAAAKPTPPVSGMRLYHGSPEDFSKFDPQALGMNTGAQYGHGFYFTDNIEHARAFGPFGYQVNIKARPDQFLDYFKELSQQSPYMQNVLRKLLGDQEFNAASRQGLAGEDAYEMLWNKVKGDDVSDPYKDLQATADYMSKNGIAGITHQYSAARGGAGYDGVPVGASDARNYAVFDPKKIQIINKFDANSTPPAINGIDLSGVDKIRKVLSSYRSDAMASGNAADGRAAQAVLNAFDKRIDDAVNGGNFTGDKTAINAWNNARAANADYRSTFTAQNRDPVGRAVQKILGDNTNDPLTPTKVIDQIVGSTGSTPSTLNIAIAKRVKGILGEQSPEWTAVKQGLLSRLLTAGEGEAQFGTGAMAQRLSKFLNGDMASMIYSPDQLSMLRSFGNLMRDLTMPSGSYFPSAPGFVAAMRGRMGAILGAIAARSITPAPVELLGELGGLKVGALAEKHAEDIFQTRRLRKLFPMVGNQMKQWEKALAKAQKVPTEPNRAAAAFQANNLAQTLAPLGIDLQKLLSSPTVFGGPNQDQQNQAPVPQQQRGGRVNQQRYAAGGSVKAQGKPLMHPRVPNARLAHDGHYYAHDPARPGKFLKVVETPRHRRGIAGRQEGGVAPAVDSDLQDWDALPKDASGRPIVTVTPKSDDVDPAMLMPMPKYTPPLRPIPAEPHNEWGDPLPASRGESIGEGLAQGATAGWSHQIRAAQKASGVPDWLPGQLPVGAARLAWEHLTGQSDGPASTAYNDALLKIQNRAAKIREDHPYLETGAEWVGAAASMGLVAPEVGMFPPLAAGIKLGAGYGGLYGASQKAEEKGLLTAPLEVAEAGGKGALIGGTTGALTGSIASGPAARAAVGATLGAGYGAKKGYEEKGWSGVPKSAIEYSAIGAAALPFAGYVGENAARTLGEKAGVLPFRAIKTPGEPAPIPPSPSRALLPDVSPDAGPAAAIAPPTISGPTSNLPSLIDAIKQRFDVPDDVAQGIRSQLLVNPDLQTIRIPGKASLPWPVSRFGGQLPVGENLRDLARYEASQPAVRLAQQAEARYSSGANLDQKVRDIIGAHDLPPETAPVIRSQILSDPTRTEINVGAHTFDIGPLTIGLGPNQATLGAPPSWTLSFGGKDVNLARAQGAAKDVNTGTAAARAGLFPATPMKGATAVEPRSTNVIPLPLKTPAVAERSPAQAITDRWAQPTSYDEALKLARAIPASPAPRALPSPAHTVADRWIQQSPDDELVNGIGLLLARKQAAEEVKASAQRPYDYPAQYRVPPIDRSSNHRLFPRDERPPIIDLMPEESPARTVADRWIQPRVAGVVP